MTVLNEMVESGFAAVSGDGNQESEHMKSNLFKTRVKRTMFSFLYVPLHSPGIKVVTADKGTATRMHIVNAASGALEVECNLALRSGVDQPRPRETVEKVLGPEVADRLLAKAEAEEKPNVEAKGETLCCF